MNPFNTDTAYAQSKISYGKLIYKNYENKESGNNNSEGENNCENLSNYSEKYFGYVVAKRNDYGLLVDNYKSFRDLVKHGLFTSYYPNGVMKDSALFINGKVSGKRVERYDNGKLRVVSNWKNGVKDGEQCEFWANNKMQTKYIVKNGVLNGYKNEYSENGNIISTIKYTNGKTEDVVELERFLQQGNDLNAADLKSSCRKFIKQYPQSPQTVEALYMIGKSFLDRKDRENAIANFIEAEQQHIKFVSAGSQGNIKFAAEAAFALASIKREDFAAIKFTLPDAKFKADQKTKTAFLLEASNAFEHVIQYQSEKMFEAAYWIGQMYEDIAETWKNQQRPKLDPIKLAVLEKDIALVASTLLQKSFAPYKKAIEMSLKFDSLSTDQKLWVHKTKVALAKNYVSAGAFMHNGVNAMQNAPVPDEIKTNPLYYYQYQKQLLEVLEPMKLQMRQYYFWAFRQLDSLKIVGENSKKCFDEGMSVNFLIGNEYDKLADKILNDPELSKKVSDADKKELTHELRYKAIANYEESLGVLGKENFDQAEYNGKIIQSLARLRGDK